MTLKQKSLLLIFSSVLIVMAVMLVFADRFLIDQAEQFEEESAQQNLKRTLGAIDAEFDHLRAQVTDWSQWDESYFFIAGTRPEFVEENLQKSTFETNRVDLMLFLDAREEVVWGKWLNPETKDLEVLPKEVVELFSEPHRQVIGSSGLGAVSGAVAAQDQIFLCATHAQLKYNGAGPAVGSESWCQRLTKAHLVQLLRAPSFRIQIEALSSSDLAAPGARLWPNSAHSQGGLHVFPVSDDELKAIGLVAGYGGLPVVAVHLLHTREVVSLARTSLARFSLLMGLFALGLGGGLFLLLSRQVLGRLRKLSEAAARSPDEETASPFPGASSTDEIGQLEKSLDASFRALQTSRGEAVRREQQFRQLAEMLPQIVAETDFEGRITFLNDQGREMLGRTPDAPDALPHLTDLVREEDRARVEEFLSHPPGGEESGRIELSLIRKDGAAVEVALYGRPLGSEEGRPGMRLLAVDVSDRNRRERQLERKDRLLRAIAETMTALQESGEVHDGIRQALSRLGHQLDVDRASLFRIALDENDGTAWADRLEMWNRSTFINELAPPPDRFRLPGVLLARLQAGESMPVSRSDDEPVIQEAMEQILNINSMLLLPVKADGVLYGALSFSCATEIRVWEKDEVSVLDLLATGVGAILTRRHLEDALKESERNIRSILETIRLAALTLDDQGRILFINPYLSDLIGWTPEEATGRNWFDLAIPEPVRESMRLDYLRGFASRTIPEHMENEILTRTGETRLIEWSNTFQTTLNGWATACAGIGQDITESRRTWLKLRESEDQHRTVTENTSDIIMRFDREGRFLFVNSAIRAVSGVDPAFFVGRDLLDLNFDEPLLRFWSESIQRVVAEKRPLLLPFEFEMADQRHLFDWRLVPEFDEFGSVRSVLTTARDVTDQRLLEAQLLQAQKMEAIGRLAGGMAHDFNNLLTGISGNVSMALMDLDSESPVYGMMQDIDKAAHRAADLTRQLLAFSRKQVMELKTLALTDMVTTLGRLMKPLIGEDIEIRIETERAGLKVRADAGHLEQAMLNLAINSRDAMPNGGKLVVSTGQVHVTEPQNGTPDRLPPGVYGRIAMIDTGHGMDEETMKRVFEPFFTTKPRGKGTGLGLSMVYGIVHQHGGYVTIRSTPGRGTAVSLYLPVAEDPSPARSASSTLPPAGDSPLPRGRERVLMVEDDPLVRQLNENILTRLGYSVISAGNGTEAMGKVFEDQIEFDLLMTDVIMPGMNGRELADRLLAERPDLPVLFCSGYAEDVIGEHGVLDPGTHFLHKPYSPHALAVKLRETLRSKTGI